MSEKLTCPICFSTQTSLVLKARDYTVSGEFFDIWECHGCRGRFTGNPPAESEIGKYYQASSYISHSDTRKGIVNKLYHQVRKYSLRQKGNLLEKLTKGKQGHVLDIGSGTGVFLEEMKRRSWSITGLEPDEQARERAKELHGIPSLPPAELFNLSGSAYDVVTLWHVLEHVHNLHGYLQEFRRLLKPGGKLIIAVPNFCSPDADKYGAYWAAYDVPRHLYHFSRQAMENLIHQHQFQLLEMKPMWFDSFYVSLLSEKYKYGRTRLLPALKSGLSSNLKARQETGLCSSIIYIIGEGKEPDQISC